MKNLKRVLSLLLCFVMLAGMLPTVALQAHAAGNYLIKPPQNITLAPGETKGVSIIFEYNVYGGTNYGNANISADQYGAGRLVNFGATAGVEVTPYSFTYDPSKVGTTETYYLSYTCTDNGTNLPGIPVSFTVTYVANAGETTITGVLIDPTSVSMQNGETKQFTATVTGSGDYDQSVTWSVENATDSNTKISASGILTVGAAETAKTLIVKATSVGDSSKSASAKVELVATVSGITIDPASVYVIKGNTQQFTATLTGIGNYGKTILWSIPSEHHTDTKISDDGLLTVSASETAETLRITATSVHNLDVWTEAAVTVAPCVTSITITPDSAEVEKGTTRQFTATLDGVGDYHKGVLWSLPDDHHLDTKISDNGLLTVSASETEETLRITATSVESNKVWTNAYVTVTEPAPKTATIVVKKTDENGQPLVGATFTMTGNNVGAGGPYTATSDANGIATFEDVTDGSYTITETTAPEGYERDATPAYIDVVNGKAIVYGEGEGYEGGQKAYDNNDPFVFVNEQYKATFYVTKTDGTKSLAGAAFKLENTVAGRTGYTATSAADGKVTFTDVVDGEYILSETQAPEGYTKSESVVYFKVENGEVKYSSDRNSYVAYYNTLSIVNEKTAAEPETVDISGTKTWVGDEETDRPESIIVNLLANGETVDEVEVTAETQWTFRFSEQPKYDESGAEIEYTVEEEPVEGYTATYDGFDITNTKDEEPEPATVDITVVKEWDVPEGTVLPDSIEVYLIVNGETLGDSNVTLSKENEWTYTWEGMEVKDNDDIPVEYSVGEVELEGYESSVGDPLETDTGIEIAITNTYVPEEEPETVDISGTKTWVGDEEADRPESIIVNLLADGKVIAEAEVTARTQWTFHFNELPKYDEAGEEIEYTVEEEEVEGYTATYDGYNITNTKDEEPEPETVDVAGTKTWVDDEEADRPESIIVNLLKNGEAIDEVEVTARTQWTFHFDELPKYDETGKEIEYSVEEEAVEGYTASYEGFNITNTKDEEPEPETVEVAGRKTWVGDEEADRPESIIVNLLADGEVIDEADVTARTQWTFHFNDLPKHDESGKEIEYSVEEEAVEGYTATYDGYNITNTLEEDPEPEQPETIDITVVKEWDVPEGTALPESIMVKLIANGNPVNEAALTKENEWTHTWIERPKFDNDNIEIIYSVEEVKIEGYECSVGDTVETDTGIEIAITNTLVEDPKPEDVTIEIPVTKTVRKGGNVDFSGSQTFEFEVEVLNSNVDADELTIIGNSVTVTNMQGGSTTIKISIPGDMADDVLSEGLQITEKAGTAQGWTYSTESYLVVPSDTGWSYYLEGETANTAVETIVFTNTYTKNETPAPTTSVTVNKVWAGNLPNNMSHPTSVTVFLKANGTKVADSEVTLNANKQWTHTWEDLPAKDANGRAIEYMVGENAVANYTTSIAVTDAVNHVFKITNTWNPTIAPVKYTVTYKANGGSGTMTSDTVDAGTEYTIRANGFTAPSGKKFKCWKIGTKEYDPGDKIIVNSDVTITAVWKNKPSGGSSGLDYVPKTGDSSGILLWTALGLMSAMALVGVEIYRKRRVR